MSLTGTAFSLNTGASNLWSGIQSFTSAVLNDSISGTAVSTDTSLTDNSDTKITTQKAVKSYIDTLLGFKEPTISTKGTLAGTTNQIYINGGTNSNQVLNSLLNSSATLSLAQDIHTGATPTFTSLILSNQIINLGTGTSSLTDFPTISANITGATDPGLRYNTTSNKWQYLNIGDTWADMGSSGGGASLTLSGSAGYLQFNGTTNLSGTSNLFWDNSTNRLGINTTTPNKAFTVNGDIAVNDINRYSCPSGYIMVPGNSDFGTKDFCVMKYEASKSNIMQPVSVAGTNPWVNISWYEAKNACERAGAHLITEAEWMTIARNIEATEINDLTGSNQYANGHSNNSPASALATGGTEPNISSCNLTLPLSNAANAYSSTCQLRGTNGNTSDMGYSRTNSNYSNNYSINASGTATKSEMRSHVLSNGQIIWDFAGNLMEWSDMLRHTTSSLWYSSSYIDWDNANLSDYEKLVAGPSTNLVSANGIGQYYGTSADLSATSRSSKWNAGLAGGIYQINMDPRPISYGTDTGIRCAK